MREKFIWSFREETRRRKEGPERFVVLWFLVVVCFVFWGGKFVVGSGALAVEGI